MCFFFSLIPMTVFLVIGYFVLFSSKKAEGAVKKFGQVLGIWVIIVAFFFLLCGAYMGISGKCPKGKMMMRHNMDMMEHHKTEMPVPAE